MIMCVKVNERTIVWNISLFEQRGCGSLRSEKDFVKSHMRLWTYCVEIWCMKWFSWWLFCIRRQQTPAFWRANNSSNGSSPHLSWCSSVRKHRSRSARSCQICTAAIVVTIFGDAGTFDKCAKPVHYPGDCRAMRCHHWVCLKPFLCCISSRACIFHAQHIGKQNYWRSGDSFEIHLLCQACEGLCDLNDRWTRARILYAAPLHNRHSLFSPHRDCYLLQLLWQQFLATTAVCVSPEPERACTLPITGGSTDPEPWDHI